MMSTPRILIVVHQETSTPGRIGELLGERGYELERCCPCAGDTLPTRMDVFHGTIVFGGPQSANDDHLPGIRAELDWLESTALPAGRPLLGICLGAQQMARVLGARVGPHPEGLVEIGYHQIAPTGACDRFMGEAGMFYQWHSETFEIPADAVHLAHSESFPGQAFRHGEKAYAIEFHPEMTLDMINRWCTSESGSRKLSLRGARPHEEHVTGYETHSARTDSWLNGFLDTLFGPGRYAPDTG